MTSRKVLIAAAMAATIPVAGPDITPEPEPGPFEKRVRGHMHLGQRTGRSAALTKLLKKPKRG